MKNAVGDTR